MSRTMDNLLNISLEPLSTEELLLLGLNGAMDVAMERLYSCDCCDRRVPADELATGYAYGIETTACSYCRGEKRPVAYSECEISGMNAEPTEVSHG